MTGCELVETADVEMYFYGELDPADRARVELHLRGCEPCRRRLEDLHAIRRALASRPFVDAPPAGDWSGFMVRLDRAIAPTAAPSNPRFLKEAARGARPRWSARQVFVLAAVLALVTMGVVMASRARVSPEPRIARGAPAVETTAPKAAAQPDRALRAGSAEHLERSKLVVLGLAARDPRIRPEDWQYERTLAGALLSDTRLYRQAAIQNGASDVARVMRDLETVLLEASMSDTRDRAALERVQRLIAKRDLVVKMQGMAASAPAGN
jgi:hypothetical protein